MTEKTRSRTPVLIVGAGPTGLVLALGLARRGVPFRIVSEAHGPGAHSRAMVVHARTLEFYGQYGFAEEVIRQGIKIDRAHLREGGRGRELLSVPFGDLGEGLSPYPFPLAYPQDDHERLLLAKLKEAGADVEWGVRLVEFTQSEHGVTATLAHEDGRREIEADYICGCDGARSAVRQTLKLGFPGGTYPQLYYVADVKIAGGFRRDLFINLGENAFALLLPVRSTGMQRLIGLVPPDVPESDHLSYEDLRAHIEPLVDAHATAVNWFSTYRVHHRVAEHFRVGRAFVLGDAGHIHSPTGGQGMNTGIGDAVNLGWKLAMVVQGRASASLLDTYEAERIAFAQRLVATTDRAFTSMVAGGIPGRIARRFLIPLLFTLGTRFEIGRHAFFRLVSQIEIEYEDSELSEGKAGHVASGDRLPWVPGDDTDNFAPLRSLDWQVHVYGEPESGLAEACGSHGLALHVLPWSAAAHDAGLERDAAYLVRPDGYVALASTSATPAKLAAYAERVGVSFGKAEAPSVETGR